MSGYLWDKAALMPYSEAPQAIINGSELLKCKSNFEEHFFKTVSLLPLHLTFFSAHYVKVPKHWLNWTNVSDNDLSSSKTISVG